LLELQKPKKVMKKVKATASAVALGKSPSVAKGKLAKANIRVSMPSPSPNKRYVDVIRAGAASSRADKQKAGTRPQDLSRIALKNYNNAGIRPQAGAQKSSTLLEAA
jgi:hypothetical protein